MSALTIQQFPRDGLFYRDGRAFSADALGRVKPTKRADTFTTVETFPCSRCGGQGGSEAWRHTGWVCYQCGGRNSSAFHIRQVMLYTMERLSALRAVADKKVEKKRAVARRKADEKRQQFIAWAKPHGRLIGRILIAGAGGGEGFIPDLASKLRSRWSLSDRQLEAAAKTLDARDERRAKDGASEYVGDIKERIDFDGTVEFDTTREGHYGTTHIIKFRDGDGNVYVWFASGVQEIQRGDRVHVRGTVKKHDEFRGVKQTTLSRCAVERLAEPALEAA